MDRRSFFRRAGAVGAGAAAASALAAPAIAQQNPRVNWRLTSSFPKGLDAIYDGATEIAAHVAEATDGQFNIQVFPPGELASPLQAVDVVASGEVDMAHSCAYYYTEKDPAFALGTAIPFGLNARLTNSWLYQGGGTELLNEFFATYNLYALPAGNTGAQMGGWFRKEINTVDDFKGLRMRIAGLTGKVMEKLGIVPQQLAGGDVYAALERGDIDATEFIGPYDDQKLGFYKVAKYYYYPAWWEGGPTVHAFFNLEKWRSLPKSYQRILAGACAFANTNMLAKYDRRNAQALKQLVSDGAILRPFSQEILEASFNAAQSVYDSLVASNPAFKALYESQQALKRDSYLWIQLAEYSFDAFMILQQRAGRL